MAKKRVPKRVEGAKSTVFWGERSIKMKELGRDANKGTLCAFITILFVYIIVNVVNNC